MCILKLSEFWRQCCPHASLRPSLSRWMRRTRPIPWCLWPPSPKSPSTSRPPTASLRQKMGPTRPPPPTDTLPPRLRWPTRRCERWRPPWPPRRARRRRRDPPTHKALSTASETVHALRQIQHGSAARARLPSSAPRRRWRYWQCLQCEKFGIAGLLPVPKKKGPTCAVFGTETAQRGTDWDFVSCPDFSRVVTIIVEATNNAKRVLLIPEEAAAHDLLFQSTTVAQRNHMKPCSWKETSFLYCSNEDWRLT